MIKERIIQLIEFKGLPKEKFYRDIGVTSANFRGKAKESPLNSNAIENIITLIPDVNIEWLLTGKGDMIKLSREVPEVKVNKSHNGIPLLPFNAFAGIGDNGINGVAFSTIEERYEVPLFKSIKVDFMLQVRGSSMYPKYTSGDVVACLLVKELLYIQWNKVYVLDTISQGTIMKRLKKSTRDDCVLCVSDNKEYDPFDLPRSEIRNIALVVGVIRLE